MDIELNTPHNRFYRHNKDMSGFDLFGINYNDMSVGPYVGGIYFVSKMKNRRQIPVRKISQEWPVYIIVDGVVILCKEIVLFADVWHNLKNKYKTHPLRWCPAEFIHKYLSGRPEKWRQS